MNDAFACTYTYHYSLFVNYVHLLLLAVYTLYYMLFMYVSNKHLDTLCPIPLHNPEIYRLTGIIQDVSLVTLSCAFWLFNLYVVCIVDTQKCRTRSHKKLLHVVALFLFSYFNYKLSAVFSSLILMWISFFTHNSEYRSCLKWEINWCCTRLQAQTYSCTICLGQRW